MSTLPPKIKSLYGHTPQGAAGRLLKESQYVWRYEATQPERALSLGMPIRAATYNQNNLHPIFAMNLPEGEQFHYLRTRFAKQFSKFDELAVLSITGRDQIGRITLSLSPEPPPHKPAVFGLKQLRQAKASEGIMEAMLEQYYDAGISGVQPKVLIPDADQAYTPSDLSRATARQADLIVKTGGASFPFLSQNEYLCMLAARIAGMAVPEFHLSDDGSLFMMRRFDLRAEADPAQGSGKLGFEDFTVLANMAYDSHGDYKYKGNYEGMAKLLGAFCPGDAARQQFFEYLTLSCMVRNGDAHLKNFGLLYEHPGNLSSVRLAPLYDVVTTTIYDYTDPRTGRGMIDRTLALRINRSSSYPSRAELCTFGSTHCAIKHPEQVIERIATAMGQAWAQCKGFFSHEYASKINAEWESGKQTYGSTRKHASA